MTIHRIFAIERRNKMNAIKYLQNKEWSMGNGQCPECGGVPESWHGHPCHMTAESIGHKHDCYLAGALLELGVKPLMRGKYKSEVVYEIYTTEEGFLSTRPDIA
jgi:hypothetical protein